ncbi:unnamed protein product, partial [Arabidopsis halleri]
RQDISHRIVLDAYIARCNRSGEMSSLFVDVAIVRTNCWLFWVGKKTVKVP